jgi:hypothetical protein
VSSVCVNFEKVMRSFVMRGVAGFESEVGQGDGKQVEEAAAGATGDEHAVGREAAATAEKFEPCEMFVGSLNRSFFEAGSSVSSVRAAESLSDTERGDDALRFEEAVAEAEDADAEGEVEAEVEAEVSAEVQSEVEAVAEAEPEAEAVASSDDG